MGSSVDGESREGTPSPWPPRARTKNTPSRARIHAEAFFQILRPHVTSPRLCVPGETRVVLPRKSKAGVCVFTFI